MIYCCQHETERRSQSLRYHWLCHAGSRHPCRVNSDGWGSRYRFTAPRFSTTIRCCSFQVIRAAYGRFMRRSRIPKHSCRHIYSRCEVRSCGAVAGARTLGVNMLSENAFKEMPTLADKSSDFGFSSGIQVYFWTQRAWVADRGEGEKRWCESVAGGADKGISCRKQRIDSKK